MIPVDCLFVTPLGEPIANSPVTIQPYRASYTDDLEGVVMPRAVEAVTDSEGKVTVELWPSPVLYYVQVEDTNSDAEVFYKFQVPPTSAPGVALRLQDLVVDDVLVPGFTARLPVTGSRSDGTALAHLLKALNNLGLIFDQTTP